MFAPLFGRTGLSRPARQFASETQTITKPADTHTFETYTDDGLLMLLITSAQNEMLK
jgi:hypothetical protein